MTRVLHRQSNVTPPVAVAGHRIMLVDRTGREYLDASGGAAVSCLGHGHPDGIAAMHAQIDRLAFAHTSFFTTDVAEALAEHLNARAPEGMASVYMVSGGSEGVEASPKHVAGAGLHSADTDAPDPCATRRRGGPAMKQRELRPPPRGQA